MKLYYFVIFKRIHFDQTTENEATIRLALSWNELLDIIDKSGRNERGSLPKFYICMLIMTLSVL